MPFTLAELSKSLEDKKRIPFGFFVSMAVWSGLKEHIRNGGHTLVGAKIVLDPKLPDTEFEVAFTEDAWNKRLASLRAETPMMALSPQVDREKEQ